MKNFEEIKPYLAVKLYNVNYFNDVGLENIIGYHLTDSIYAALVFDLPHTIDTVTPEQIKQWDKTTEELIRIGKANIKLKYTFEVTQQELDEFSVWLIDEDHFFASNFIFELEDHQNLLGDKGALIGVPNRHTFLIYPINSIETVNAITPLISAIYTLDKEGPGSISSDLYYYNHSQLIKLPYTLNDNKIVFLPTEDFIKILNSLT